MAWISENYGFDCESDLLYQKVSIQQLSPELSQSVIVGIVIAKQDARCILSKKQPGSERYVLNFTLRDSPNDTINAMCWGEENNVKSLSSSFSIGDVIKIKNPQILERQTDAMDEKFRPPVSSHYYLNISALYSEIVTCTGEESDEYKKLLHCAMHGTSDLITLADVVHNSQNAEGLSLNFLVAIKDIKPPQTMKTKNGKELTKLLISVFDQTHPAFPIVIWDAETANFILQYFNKRSVLLVTDIKIGYNAYMKEVAATAVSSTVFTPEPDIPERRVLYQYAAKMSIPNEANKAKLWDSSKPFTVELLNEAMNTSESDADEMEGTVHAVLTMFDIDGSTNIFSLKCPKCYQPLPKPDDKCTNGACEVGSGVKFSSAEEVYDIVISLTDETANFIGHLGGQAAENLLGLKVKEYLTLSSDEKTKLKWKFLFERFTVNFKVSQSWAGNGRQHVRVVHMQKDE